jgi:drug/metabolite transporter (DMT)-like permease
VPVITALIAHFIYKERLKGIQWVATALSFSGVALLTMFNGIFTISNELIWLLTAAVCLSLYNILQRKLTKTYSALQTSAFSIFGGTIMLSIFLPASVAEVKCAPAVPLLYIAILGVFSSAIAYVSWSKAFSQARNTSSVSNYMFVTPFLTTLLEMSSGGCFPDDKI